MKTIRLLFAVALFTGYIASLSSCTVTFKSNNGKHKGWFKNPKNPRTTNPKTPGNGSKGKDKEKRK